VRRAAKVDRPQSEITEALRQCAISVQPLHSVGKGVPDLLCGFRGINVLLELKDGALPPSGRKLTADETAWHGKWSGQVAVVGSAQEAIDAVIAAAREAGRI
jgi:hypothetical protein